MEEGCLSLPGVHVDVERPIHVRVRAQDEQRRADPRRGHGPRGAGHPARDGPPRRRPDPRPHAARPAQGGDAGPPRAPRGGLRHRLPRHLGLRRRRPRAPRAPPITARRSSSRGPTAPQGRGRKLTPPPVADAARELGIDARPARVGQRRRGARARSPPRRADVVVVCAFGALIKEPLLSDSRAPQRPPVAAAALARRGAGRAGDHGRRRARPACRSCASPPGSTPGRCASTQAEPIRPDDNYGTLARAPGGRSARELLVRALDERPPFARAARGRRHLRREDHRRGPHARPATRRARGQRARRPRAAPAHRRAPAARRRLLPRRPARARRRGRRRSSCSRSSRAGGRPMAYADYLRGHAAR